MKYYFYILLLITSGLRAGVDLQCFDVEGPEEDLFNSYNSKCSNEDQKKICDCLKKEMNNNALLKSVEWLKSSNLDNYREGVRNQYTDRLLNVYKQMNYGAAYQWQLFGLGKLESNVTGCTPTDVAKGFDNALRDHYLAPAKGQCAGNCISTIAQNYEKHRLEIEKDYENACKSAKNTAMNYTYEKSYTSSTVDKIVGFIEKRNSFQSMNSILTEYSNLVANGYGDLFNKNFSNRIHHGKLSRPSDDCKLNEADKVLLEFRHKTKELKRLDQNFVLSKKAEDVTKEFASNKLKDQLEQINTSSLNQMQANLNTEIPNSCMSYKNFLTLRSVPSKRLLNKFKSMSSEQMRDFLSVQDPSDREKVRFFRANPILSNLINNPSSKEKLGEKLVNFAKKSNGKDTTGVVEEYLNFLKNDIKNLATEDGLYNMNQCDRLSRNLAAVNLAKDLPPIDEEQNIISQISSKILTCRAIDEISASGGKPNNLVATLNENQDYVIHGDSMDSFIKAPSEDQEYLDFLSRNCEDRENQVVELLPNQFNKGVISNQVNQNFAKVNHAALLLNAQMRSKESSSIIDDINSEKSSSLAGSVSDNSNISQDSGEQKGNSLSSSSEENKKSSLSDYEQMLKDNFAGSSAITKVNFVENVTRARNQDEEAKSLFWEKTEKSEPRSVVANDGEVDEYRAESVIRVKQRFDGSSGYSDYLVDTSVDTAESEVSGRFEAIKRTEPLWTNASPVSSVIPVVPSTVAAATIENKPSQFLAANNSSSMPASENQKTLPSNEDKYNDGTTDAINKHLDRLKEKYQNLKKEFETKTANTNDSEILDKESETKTVKRKPSSEEEITESIQPKAYREIQDSVEAGPAVNRPFTNNAVAGNAGVSNINDNKVTAVNNKILPSQVDASSNSQNMVKLVVQPNSVADRELKDNEKTVVSEIKAQTNDDFEKMRGSTDELLKYLEQEFKGKALPKDGIIAIQTPDRKSEFLVSVINNNNTLIFRPVDKSVKVLREYKMEELVKAINTL